MAAAKKSGSPLPGPLSGAPKAEKKPAAPAAPKSVSNVNESASKAHGFRRKMTGRVIKDKMNKSVVVECVSASRDALYGKYVRSRTRYKAHDETNQYKVGDEVEIQEHSPISRDKRFIVVRLIKKFVEE